MALAGGDVLLMWPETEERLATTMHSAWAQHHVEFIATQPVQLGASLETKFVRFGASCFGS